MWRCARTAPSLASASTGGTVLLWDTNSPDPPKTYPGHGTTAVRAVALSPKAPTAASSDANGRVAIWNLETLQTEHVLNIHAASVTARRTKEGVNICASQDGRLVLCTYSNGALRGWDLTAGPEPVIRAEPRGGGGTAMYDVNTGRRRIVGDERSHFYSDIALTADTRFGVFATNAGLLLVRELANWTPVASFACDEELFACAVSADGSWVAAAGQDSVYLFKLNGLHPHQVP